MRVSHIKDKILSFLSFECYICEEPSWKIVHDECREQNRIEAMSGMLAHSMMMVNYPQLKDCTHGIGYIESGKNIYRCRRCGKEIERDE